MKTVVLLLMVLVCVNCSTFAQTITIGNQVWMSRNLDVSTFRNGEPINQAKTEAEWYNAGRNKQPAWCYYNFDQGNGTKYGKLYNWYAIIDSRGLAPVGYHIPSGAEWAILLDFLGGYNISAAKKMKSTSGWNENGNGTNESGFNGLPGGMCNDAGKFHNLGKAGYWWQGDNKIGPSGRALIYDSGVAAKAGASSATGFSVRCLKD